MTTKVVHAVEVKVVLADLGISAQVLLLKTNHVDGLNLSPRPLRQQRGRYAFLAVLYLVLEEQAGAPHGRVAAGHAELAEQRRDMVLDRALGAVQALGDVSVGQALRK